MRDLERKRAYMRKYKKTEAGIQAAKRDQEKNAKLRDKKRYYNLESGRKDYVINRKKEKRQDPEYWAKELEQNRIRGKNPRIRAIKTAYENKRRALKLQATSKWLTEQQIEQMKEFYINCPNGHEVDHIIPLKSNIVCGLHVPWNLQYLTVKENRKKHNRLVVVK